MPLIVIAEDEFPLADMLAAMLENAGIEVAAAAHGRDALTLVRERRPQLVITDFMMPLMTGLEPAQAMRSENDLSTIPIMLVSWAQGSIGRANPDMFDLVLDKPYSENNLIAAVQNLIPPNSV